MSSVLREPFQTELFIAPVYIYKQVCVYLCVVCCCAVDQEYVYKQYKYMRGDEHPIRLPLNGERE